MITCPRCGYQAPDGTPYCPRCGYGRPPVPPAPPAPVPEKQTAKKKKPGCGTYILFAVGILAAFLVIMYIGSFIYRAATGPEKTPTMSPNQIMDAAQKTASVLQTQTAAASILPTATPDYAQTLEIIRLTPTSTEQAVSYCNNMILVWKSDADYLRAPGTLSFESFDHQLPESCRYVLSGNSHDGKMIMYLDDEGLPYVTDFTMDVSDPSDQDALIGWVSAVASYLDVGTPTTIRRNLIDALDTGTLMLKTNAITIDRDADPLWKVEITRQY